MAPRWTVLHRTNAGCPEGWELVTALKSGATVKYYTNVLGQKFYSRADLERNIEDFKLRGLSIYAPDFEPPTPRTSSRRRNPKPEVVCSSDNDFQAPASGTSKRKQNPKLEDACSSSEVPLETTNQTEAKDREETQCATPLSNLSAQSKFPVTDLTNARPRRATGPPQHLKDYYVS